MKNIFLILLMAITGTGVTVFFSLQLEVYSLGKKYNHIWTETHQIILAEFFCLFIYLIYTCNRTNLNSVIDEEESEEENQKSEASIFLLIFPAFCDIIAETLYGYALNNMPTSVFQMLKAALVIFTAFFSYIFLGKRQYRHHLIGLFIIFGAVVSLGVSGVTEEQHVPNRKPKYIEELLLVIGMIFQGLAYTFEEYIFRDYSIDTLKVVSLEGMWGTIIYLLITPFLVLFRCDKYAWRVDVCTVNNKDEWRVGDIVFSYQQIASSKYLIALISLGFILTILYITLGMKVLREMNSNYS